MYIFEVLFSKDCRQVGTKILLLEKLDGENPFLSSTHAVRRERFLLGIGPRPPFMAGHVVLFIGLFMIWHLAAFRVSCQTTREQVKRAQMPNLIDQLQMGKSELSKRRKYSIFKSCVFL